MGLDKSKIAFVVIVVIALYHFLFSRPIHHPPGVKIPSAPEQSVMQSGQRGFKYEGHFIEPLAHYKISFRILSIENYWTDHNSDISPVDWAVGWKEMSDSRYLDELDISQSHRFYFYSWNSNAVLPDPEVMKNNSANVHLIPSSKSIEKLIKKARIGHLVDMKGYLVRVSKKDGSEMLSSLLREDSGARACEVIWVTEVRYRN